MSTMTTQSMKSQIETNPSRLQSRGDKHTVKHQQNRIALKGRQQRHSAKVPEDRRPMAGTGRVAKTNDPPNGVEPEFEEFNGEFQFTLAHAFVILGYVVGFAAVVVFGLDLLVKIPFWRESVIFDLTNVLAGLGLIYLSWNCHRDLP